MKVPNARFLHLDTKNISGEYIRKPVVTEFRFHNPNQSLEKEWKARSFFGTGLDLN